MKHYVTLVLLLFLVGCEKTTTSPNFTTNDVDAQAVTSSKGLLTKEKSSGDMFDATTPVPSIYVEAGLDFDVSVVSTTSLEALDSGNTSPSLVVEAGLMPEAGPTCEVEYGFCNPLCKDHCGEGKTCGYTPTRSSEFMCVPVGGTGLYSFCRLDDDCEAGTVCVDHVCKLPCAEDSDCDNLPMYGGVRPSPEGVVNTRVAKDVCSPVVEGLKVCERFCHTGADLICGEGVECRVVDAQTTPTTLMCVSVTPIESVVVLDGSFESLQLLQLKVGEACQTNSECSDDGTIVCQEGVCKTFCQSVEDCSGNQCIYDPNTGSGACEICPHNPKDVCNPILGCGCPEGSDCKTGLDQISTCIPSTNTQQPEQSWCRSNSDCAVGLSCLAGLCRPVCEDDSDCASGGRCLLTISGREVNVSTCSGACDPINGGVGCGEGALCYPAYDGPAICVSEASTPPNDKGSTCSQDYDCANGLGCSQGVCRSWCTSNSDCLGATSVCNRISPNRYGLTTSDLIGYCEPSP